MQAQPCRVQDSTTRGLVAIATLYNREMRALSAPAVCTVKVGTDGSCNARVYAPDLGQHKGRAGRWATPDLNHRPGAAGPPQQATEDLLEGTSQ